LVIDSVGVVSDSALDKVADCVPTIDVMTEATGVSVTTVVLVLGEEIKLSHDANSTAIINDVSVLLRIFTFSLFFYIYSKVSQRFATKPS